MIQHLIWLSLLLFACNQQNTTYESRNDTAVQHSDENKEGYEKRNPSNALSTCYRRVRDRDTLLVQLQQEGTAWVGKMLFDNYQIDGSRGTLKGIQKEDTLQLWYRFESEGMQSVREMRFLKKGDSLLMGSGDFQARGDSTLFKPGAEILFRDAVFQTDCRAISRQMNF